ncbi:MAG TPA: hypothetical protein VFW48_00795 [Solirubrobacterales bacterium]|nr:hypothetical protein [Solirubrobacterales bacterium]
MAEKTKARQKPKPRSRGSTRKASKSPAAKSRKTAASTSRSGSRSKASSSRSKASSNGSGRIDTAKHAVEETAKDAGHAVGGAVSKAKVPLMAGGAALAGAAGGLVLGARQARRNGPAARALSRRPQVKVRSQDLARAAKEVGSFGAQMGRLATELQQTREAVGNGKHRSPVEVVLEGLTRRSGRK